MSATLAMIERGLAEYASNDAIMTEDFRSLTTDQRILFLRLTHSDYEDILALHEFKKRAARPATELSMVEYTRLLVGGCDAEYASVYPEFLELKRLVKDHPPMEASTYEFLVSLFQLNNLAVLDTSKTMVLSSLAAHINL